MVVTSISRLRHVGQLGRQHAGTCSRGISEMRPSVTATAELRAPPGGERIRLLVMGSDTAAAPGSAPAAEILDVGLDVAARLAWLEWARAAHPQRDPVREPEHRKVEPDRDQEEDDEPAGATRRRRRTRRRARSTRRAGSRYGIRVVMCAFGTFPADAGVVPVSRRFLPPLLARGGLRAPGPLGCRRRTVLTNPARWGIVPPGSGSVRILTERAFPSFPPGVSPSAKSSRSTRPSVTAATSKRISRPADSG